MKDLKKSLFQEKTSKTIARLVFRQQLYAALVTSSDVVDDVWWKYVDKSNLIAAIVVAYKITTIRIDDTNWLVEIQNIFNLYNNI